MSLYGFPALARRSIDRSPFCSQKLDEATLKRLAREQPDNKNFNLKVINPSTYRSPPRVPDSSPVQPEGQAQPRPRGQRSPVAVSDQASAPAYIHVLLGCRNTVAHQGHGSM